MVLPIDVLEDVSVMLTATKRKRDAEGIRVRTFEETILTDELEGRPTFQHSRFIVDDNCHKKFRCKLAGAKLQRTIHSRKD